MIIKAYIYHKQAEKYSDCQDCFGVNLQNNRIAVSDGMSQSIFPQWWSKILVDSFLEEGKILHDIRPLQEKWQRMLLDEIQKREDEALTNPKRDPWRLKNLLAEKSGAGATLCGLSLGENGWVCECIGDSCLITVNHDYSLNFYTSQVGEFGNHPDYLDSFREGRGEPIRKVVKQDAELYLMVSDPFAELFQIHENEPDFIKSRINELIALHDHTSYVNLVEEWRTHYGMHNDDSTLVLIQDIKNPTITVEFEDSLSELCAEEKKAVEKLVNNTTEPLNNLSTSVTESLSEDSQQTDNSVNTFERALSHYAEACESLFDFYRGKKKSKKMKEWLDVYSKKIIEKYIKK